MKKLNAIISLTLLAILFVLLVYINNTYLGRYRADLTESQIFSLSAGSQQVLQSLDEPVTLYFFYSDTDTAGMTSLRNYASRVKSLLEEYVQAANGKLKLQVIDPIPFSASEDKANQFGLTGAAIGHLGETIYFGLAGTNLLDDQFTIPFFDPKNEQFLEYDISKLIYQLTEPDTMTLSIVTDLPVAGGQDPVTGRYVGPMVFYQQLSQLYDIHIVRADDEAIADGTDVVILMHPQGLSDSLLYSIDQFAMHNGRILAFIDPHYEADAVASLRFQQANSSSLPLLKAWGIKTDLTNVVLDAQLGLDFRDEDGKRIKHFGILGLTAQQLDRNDVTTANLESLNGASFGALEPISKPGLTMTPLMQSSTNAGLTNADNYAETLRPASLQRRFGGNTTNYILAARYTGKARSYFQAPESPVLAQDYKAATQDLNLIVVADADLLSDRFWVQQSPFYGETLFTPFANNGDFVVNVIENLTGSSALIGIRARGTFARPFTRVEELETQAEEKYREQEEVLQQQLADNEAALSELQNQPGQGGNIVFSDEQQMAIDEQIAKRVAIRQALREVRYKLDQEIDRLGNRLKIANIIVAPLLLILLLLVCAFVFKRRARKFYTSESS
ncbi:Gldg family protein [Alteromonas sp. C1M14]|uniref:GldG family protein n=1 Tax=Alteromonas sp. C1M14 TaxID=2841567 RepID=UPI001C08DEE2|nr:Gldg family protein [Alteromonas sp. C1M14]MBU2979124.1 Gldg family protein [Alteromonas sp. C1M14]